MSLKYNSSTLDHGDCHSEVISFAMLNGDRRLHIFLYDVLHFIQAVLYTKSYVKAGTDIFHLINIILINLAIVFFLYSFGDFIPRRISSRILAMAWSLVGIIMNSLIVGSLVTTLMTLNIQKEVKLYGTKVCMLYYLTLF